MKFFLCQSQTMVAVPHTRGSNERYSCPASFFVGVTPNANPEGEEAAFWKELERLSPGVVDAAGTSVGKQGQVHLRCEVFYNDAKIGFRIKSGPATVALRDVFGERGTVHVVLSNFYVSCWGNLGTVQSSNMKFRDDPIYALQDPDLLRTRTGGFDMGYMNGLHGIALGGSVTVTVSTEVGATLPMEIIANQEIIKKMLQEGIQSDLVIIPSNGVEVKAHKSMLAAHSAVLRAMFESDMKEAKTQIVEMPDISEAGVRALLAYLYHWEGTQANENPVVAYEMLYAGHKYEIVMVENAMRKLLLGKSTQWFDVDVAMELFLFANNLPEDGDRLKKKAIKVLKRNFATLTESPTYAALFKKDPKTAMEFCAYGFGDQN